MSAIEYKNAFGFDVENALISQNGGLQTRKTKREEAGRGNGPQVCKRAALGTINANVTRKQPSRAAKQSVGNDENAFARPTTGKSTDGYNNRFFSVLPPRVTAAQPAFSIHIDSEPMRNDNKENASTELPLNTLVTSLPERLPLACVFNLDESASPMVLDSSLNDIDNESVTLIEDEDLNTTSDVFAVAEYAEDIFAYLREAELKNRPKPGYMRKQPDITAGMRCILVDWLVEVGEEYRLLNETLYLAVSYIDRFLSQMSVLRSKLQLVGAASMFLAAKFEEIYPPEVKEFVYITDDTYSIKQVLRMEHLVLKVLSFDVAVPTINVFLGRFLKGAEADTRTEHLSRYLAELTLQDHEYIKYIPSIIAAAAVCLANYTLNGQRWTQSLERYSGYLVEDIAPCVRDLLKTFTDAPAQSQQAVREKYKSQRYNAVSMITPPSSLPSW